MINGTPLVCESEATRTAAGALILGKKLKDYGGHDNFVAPAELTVTITLSEYRDLVKASATHYSELEKVLNEKRKAEYENTKLKEQLETLKSLRPVGCATGEDCNGSEAH